MPDPDEMLEAETLRLLGGMPDEKFCTFVKATARLFQILKKEAVRRNLWDSLQKSTV